MIGSFYKEDLIKSLASIITFGINNSYSFLTIEEKIVRSKFIYELEHNSFNINETLENVVISSYNLSHLARADISFKSLFIAESYIRLFFDLNKSFEYLFLFWPLDEFIAKYQIYHEMDYSNLKSDVLNKIKNNTILRLLSKKKGVKLSEIARLTGINENSIDKYAKSDLKLCGASYDTLYKLSVLFNVKSNMFVSTLAVYLDNSIYLNDKSNNMYRNYLGLYFANYFDSSINESDFSYNKSQSCFIRKDKKIELKIFSIDKGDISENTINSISNPNNYIVIFPYGFYFDIFDYFALFKNCVAKEIMVVTQENVYIIKKGITKEITETINRSLITRAKTKAMSSC